MSEITDTGLQFDSGAGEVEPTVLSMSELAPDQMHHAIHQIPTHPDQETPKVQITGAAGQDHALMRLDHPVELHVDGPLGDFAFAYNAQCDVRLTGSAGHGLADGMISGAIRVKGDVGVAAGTAMQGGMLSVYGSAGDRVGAAMRGGNIFVRGNVGSEIGVGALRGTIVIGGNAGERLGDAMNNVTIFIRGHAKSLSAGVTEAPLRKREQVKLGLLLINASIRGDASEFRRIIPTAMLRAEQAAVGEIDPHWR